MISAPSIHTGSQKKRQSKEWPTPSCVPGAGLRQRQACCASETLHQYHRTEGWYTMVSKPYRPILEKKVIIELLLLELY